jgi:hypothetical protein
VSATDFDSGFVRAARSVRSALALRHGLDGAALGALAGVVAGIGIWALRGPSFAWAGIATALVAGTIVAAVRTRRRRFSDADVALYLDARLACNEAVSTALEWRARPRPATDATRRAAASDVETEVTRVATAALASKDARAVRPRIARRLHATLPLLSLGLVALWFVPERAPTKENVARPDTVQVKLDGLRKVEALKALEPKDAADKKRWDALVDAARKLRLEAAAGMDRKAALDALQQLRTQTAAERKLVPDAARRAAMDAAAKALARHPETAEAAKALERADLVAMDHELERLANAMEAHSRAIAEEALKEAAAAARARGADDVASALEEQEHLLKKRGADADTLKKLAELLGTSNRPDVARQLERLNRGEAAASPALADAMLKALEGLSEDERKRLGDQMKKAAEGMAGENSKSLTREQMEQLARSLSSKEGLEQLQKAMKQLAAQDPSAAAAREGAIAQAMLGIGAAQREISGNGPPGDGPAGSGSDPSGQGGPSSPSPSARSAGHEGTTPPIAASSLPAHAAGTAFGGIPMGRAPGVSPVTATPPLTVLPRTGAAAIPGDVAPVTHTDVPKEYRDQVGRYFSP